MNEKEFKVLFEKILDIIENNKGEKKRIQIRDLWNSLKFDDCNNFAKYLKKIEYAGEGANNYLELLVNELHDQFIIDWWDNERKLILQANYNFVNRKMKKI